MTVIATSVQNPTIAGLYSMSVATSLDAATAVSSPGYTISAGPATQVVAMTGSDQSAGVGTAFPVPLSASVEDQYGNPETGGSGYLVTFTAPASGASGTFASNTNTPNTNTVTVLTDPSGTATATAFTANATQGQYQVTATSGNLTQASFTETNSGGGAPTSWLKCPSSTATDCIKSVTYNAGSLPTGIGGSPSTGPRSM